MTIQDAYKQLVVQLNTLYDEREAANIADLVIEHVTGHGKVDRIVHKDLHVPAAQQTIIKSYTQQLLQHTPVQYVLHEAWFAGMKLYVDENVLIPRPETEELVSWILDFRLSKGTALRQIADFGLGNNAGNKAQSPVTGNRKPVSGNLQPVTVLDIGTGSGCIPIALKKKFAHWDVHAIDISESALEVAKKNAANQNSLIAFHLLDILDETVWQQLPLFDVIVSNPPYIRANEAATMQSNVLSFEPHIALFVPDNDALLFYKKITDFALLHLNNHGILFFEINESLGNEVCAMLAEKEFTEIELRKDLQGKDRMVRAVKN